MKKIKLTFIILLIVNSLTIYAQRHKSNIFTESDYTTDTLRMEGYTYICDTLKQALVTLRNIEDHPGREDLCYADGTPLEAELATSLHLDAVVITSGIDAHIKSIVNNAFSQDQVESLEGGKLRIELNISSSSGEITDVYFTYLVFDGYANIPIEVYRNIEQRFKNEICFELTDLGRKLNYCLLSWSQCPKGRAEEVPEEESEQGTDNNSGLKTELGGVITDRGTISGAIGKGSNSLIGGKINP